MAAARQRSSRDEGGFVTVQALMIYALTLLTLVWIANFIVFQYGRGVIRASIDEGARAGSAVTASTSACEDRAHQVMGNLLGGVMGNGVTIHCSLVNGQMLAEARGTFSAWAPPMQDYSFDVTATALASKAP
jgi:hypothetical protein